MENLAYQSEFLPDVTMFIVLSDHPKYNQLKPMFDEYGYGFMVPNQNTIIIDGEHLSENPDPNLLKFIEAHEISHILLGHDGPRNENDELEADLGAYLLLKKQNRNTDIVTDNFFDRHGIEFEEKLLNIVTKKVDF